MYTFAIICTGLFLLSGIIFKKSIKEHQFLVYVMIIFGSLIGSTIVNGIYGLDVPYSKVFKKEKILEESYLNVWVNTDTISEDSVHYDTVLNALLPIKFMYEKDSLGKVSTNYVYIDEAGRYFHDSLTIASLTITLTEDTIPRIRIYKYRRIIESNWITGFGLPSRGDNSYEVTLPNNNQNQIFLELINTYLYEQIN